jgi:uncharacterized lipoprotein YajG
MKPMNLVLSIILLTGCAAHQAATLEVSKRESPLNSDNLSNSVIDENTEPTTYVKTLGSAGETYGRL